MCVCAIPGKGKTPLRRYNNIAVSVAVSDGQPKAQELESSCEKSCQVNSEQIKADMKVATEKSKRTNGKEITTDTLESTARPGADTGARQITGSTGAASGRPVTGPVSRGAFRCGRVVVGTPHGAAASTNRATEADRTNDDAKDPCGAEAVWPSAGPSSVGSLESSNGAVNNAPRRPAAEQEQQQRLPAPFVGSRSQCQDRHEDFVPRRPLTRSCTRMSSVSLVPETGKKKLKLI